MKVRSPLRVLLGTVAVVAAPLAAVVGFAGPAAAATATITLTSSGDSGPGTLRQAFVDASSGGADQADDVVVVIPGSLGLITLTSASVFYDGGMGGAHSLTINGSGNTIHQMAADRVITSGVATASLIVTGVTLSGGNVGGPTGGGGIFSRGPLTLMNTVVDHNTAHESGGGILTDATVTLTNSTLSNNASTLGSGGGVQASGAVTLRNSTISGNTASGGGGGGVVSSSTVTLTNSTIAKNAAPTNGGGGVVGHGVTLVYATVVANTAPSFGANVDVGSGALTSFGSVLALPQGGGANCQLTSPTVTHGYNWDDDGSCGFGSGPGDHSNGGNPQLGQLASNGGPTQTLLPLDGPSPLIDAVAAGSCQADGAAGVSTDQRGLPRPDASSPNCDIGAVEVQPPATPVAPTPTAMFTG